MQLTTLALLILIPLLIWRVYMRLKQFFVRQESLMWKHWTGAVLFSLLMLVAAGSLLDDGPALASLATGGFKPIIFTIAMIAGMAAFELIERVLDSRSKRQCC